MSVEDHRPAAAAAAPAVRAGPVPGAPGASRQALPPASAAHASPEQGWASAAGALACTACQNNMFEGERHGATFCSAHGPPRSWACAVPTTIAPDHHMRLSGFQEFVSNRSR